MQPNYQDWLHLAIVTIEQTWTEIYIHGGMFYKAKKDKEWNEHQRLGRNESYAASLKDSAARQSNLDILYLRTGIRKSQPRSFKGAWNLAYDEKADCLSGTYFTDRFTGKENIGSQEPLTLKKVSRDVLSISEVFQKHLETAKTIEMHLIHWQTEQSGTGNAASRCA